MISHANKLQSKHPLKNTKTLIIKTLNQYSGSLGKYAANILNDNKRLNVRKVAPGKAKMMACRPAGITIDDIKSMNMYMSDFLEKFGPFFKKQDNPKNHSIIDLDYDSTNQSVILLAHELGHAIADDIQRENGLCFRDFSLDDLEVQAYFIETIICDGLNINNRIGYLSTSRQRCIKIAYTAYQNSKIVIVDEKCKEDFIRKALGAHGHKAMHSLF